mmetsp:Transcript_34554/g.63521  ORF Transcript_34554/g.63521 Transcript_34554/m.63521 type:complete len:216 (-) Transcript_34554:265-912(-)
MDFCFSKCCVATLASTGPSPVLFMASSCALFSSFALLVKYSIAAGAGSFIKASISSFRWFSNFSKCCPAALAGGGLAFKLSISAFCSAALSFIILVKYAVPTAISGGLSCISRISAFFLSLAAYSANVNFRIAAGMGSGSSSRRAASFSSSILWKCLVASDMVASLSARCFASARALSSSPFAVKYRMPMGISFDAISNRALALAANSASPSFRK